MEQLKADGLRRTDPETYRAQIKSGYIRGVDEDRPAVISINMQMASVAVNEFLARLHPYRSVGNSNFAKVSISFSGGICASDPEEHASGRLFPEIGNADVRPLLLMPEIGE
jgi:hypothetical protein